MANQPIRSLSDESLRKLQWMEREILALRRQVTGTRVRRGNSYPVFIRTGKAYGTIPAASETAPGVGEWIPDNIELAAPEFVDAESAEPQKIYNLSVTTIADGARLEAALHLPSRRAEVNEPCWVIGGDATGDANDNVTLHSIKLGIDSDHAQTQDWLGLDTYKVEWSDGRTVQTDLPGKTRYDFTRANSAYKLNIVRAGIYRIAYVIDVVKAVSHNADGVFSGFASLYDETLGAQILDGNSTFRILRASASFGQTEFHCSAETMYQFNAGDQLSLRVITGDFGIGSPYVEPVNGSCSLNVNCLKYT